VRRSLLLTASIIGLLICLIGGTGLFAALTDSAHTGTNTVDSAGLAPSSDLKLAMATYAIPNSCGTYSDNLATGLFDYTPGSVWVPGNGVWTALCIQNAGSQSVSLSTAIDQLTDVDIACTGDEADSGDTTCGNDSLGELSGALDVTMYAVDCATGQQGAVYQPGVLSNLAGTAQAMGTIGAGETKCFNIGVAYQSTVPATLQQRAQSDRASWRFVFTGQA